MYTDDDLRQAEEQILAIVREAKGPYPSDRILDQLMRQGLPEAAIRVAMWYLVDRNQLRFDMDWRLIARDREQSREADHSVVPSVG